MCTDKRLLIKKCTTNTECQIHGQDFCTVWAKYRGRRFCTPEGVLESRGVQNPRPWEIFRSSGDVFPKTSLLSAVYGYSIVHCNQKSEQNKVSPPFLPHTIAHCPVKVFTRKLRKFTKRNLSRNCVGDPKQTHRREPYQCKQYIC